MLQNFPIISSIKLFRSKIFDYYTKKFLSKKVNFVNNISPIYYLSRAFGLLPFSVDRNSNSDILRAKVGVKDLFWFVTSISIYLFSVIINYMTFMARLEEHEQGSILILGDHLNLIFGLCYGAFVIIMDMYNRNRIIAILNKFAVFDRMVTYIHKYIIK